jgi:hypothetical protein
MTWRFFLSITKISIEQCLFLLSCGMFRPGGKHHKPPDKRSKWPSLSVFHTFKTCAWILASSFNPCCKNDPGAETIYKKVLHPAFNPHRDNPQQFIPNGPLTVVLFFFLLSFLMCTFFCFVSHSFFLETKNTRTICTLWQSNPTSKRCDLLHSNWIARMHGLQSHHCQCLHCRTTILRTCQRGLPRASGHVARPTKNFTSLP